MPFGAIAMPDIILHHYPRSPFAEKVRLALGVKSVAYASVTIPAWMPKPDLMPLTGGYRRTPVLQIGADIYCDSRLILRVLERVAPKPSLFPGGTEALATTLGWGIEKAIFNPIIGIIVGLTGHTYPRALIEDRAPFFGSSLEPEDNLRQQALLTERLGAHLATLSEMLSDGRRFLLGDDVSAADLCAYHPLWHLRRAGGMEAAQQEVRRLLPGLAALFLWMDRIAAIGHGSPREMLASEALRIAAEAAPSEPPPTSALLALRPGDRVSVTPDDTGRDPVCGRLLAATAHEITLRRHDPALGALNLHVPRAGFDAGRA